MAKNPHKPVATLLEAAPVLIPAPVQNTVVPDPTYSEQQRLANALEPFEPDPAVRNYVAEQLYAAKAWGGDSVILRVPSSMVVRMLEAATRVDAE